MEAGGSIVNDIAFLSTPSARRATAAAPTECLCAKISIHALREEGDTTQPRSITSKEISIHALREEGDCFFHGCVDRCRRFLSTPSARRATRHA